MNARRTFPMALMYLFFLSVLSAKAQSDYEPQHGVSGYDFAIKGELELSFSNAVTFRDMNSKVEGTYRIKSPIMLAFNLNDLKFFKARPSEFIGYVENQYSPRNGFAGGLVDIQQGGYHEEENWMKADVSFKSSDNEEVSEVKGRGELYPVLQVFFSMPFFEEKLKSGIKSLQFRLMISGISDSQFQPSRNVTGWAKSGPITLTEGFDLPVSVGCGAFYGTDLTNALITNSLLEDQTKKRVAFERQFEQEYFKDLPKIDVMQLINFLIKPQGNFEVPISGSFSSDGKTGSERATYNGTLRFYGNKVKKEEM